MKYEISTILKEESPALIKKNLEKVGASITSESEPTKLRLAYQIKKETMGFFTVIKFELAPNMIQKLNSELNLEKDILRFFVSKVEKVSEDNRMSGGKGEGKPYLSTRTPRKPRENNILSNEDLEKKIEEIMK